MPFENHENLILWYSGYRNSYFLYSKGNQSMKSHFSRWFNQFPAIFAPFPQGYRKGSRKIEKKSLKFRAVRREISIFFSILSEPFSIPAWKRQKNGVKLVKTWKSYFHTEITCRVEDKAFSEFPRITKFCKKRHF